MAMSYITAKNLLVAYMTGKAPYDYEDLAQDAFYTDFLKGKDAADLPALKYVIDRVKATAQRRA